MRLNAWIGPRRHRDTPGQFPPIHRIVLPAASPRLTVFQQDLLAPYLEKIKTALMKVLLPLEKIAAITLRTYSDCHKFFPLGGS
jgi:hypothetical protein